MDCFFGLFLNTSYAVLCIYASYLHEANLHGKKSFYIQYLVKNNHLYSLVSLMTLMVSLMTLMTKKFFFLCVCECCVQKSLDFAADFFIFQNLFFLRFLKKKLLLFVENNLNWRNCNRTR